MQSAKRSNFSWVLLLIFSMGSWSIAIGGHELLGHGGMCAIDPHCDWQYADAMYFDGTFSEGWVGHLTRAAGSLFNILIAAIAAMLLFRGINFNLHLTLFLWMTLTINLFQAGSYIAFGWLIHPGMDWAIISNLFPQPLGNILVCLFGGGIILSGFILSRRFYPGDNQLKEKLRLLGIPLIGCTIIAITASILMPTDNRLMMLQGGIGGSLGFLFWMIIQAFLPGPTRTTDDFKLNWQESFAKQHVKSKGDYVELILVILSITSVAFYLLILTPGLNFDPS